MLALGFFHSVIQNVTDKQCWGKHTESDLCYVIDAGEGEAVSCQVVSLRFQCCEFSLHHMFLSFTLRIAEAQSVQFQQSQTHLGRHLNTPEKL